MKIEKKKDYRSYFDYVIIYVGKRKIRINLTALKFYLAVLFVGLLVLASVFLGQSYFERDYRFWLGVSLYSIVGLLSIGYLCFWFFTNLFIVMTVDEEDDIVEEKKV